jgi:NAD(P)-dependent dehydrogenase (short-subunit alcohol dehydrogenase family)
MRLRDKVAIVTGSASGMGRGVAIHFAKEGSAVIVSDIAVEKGKETVELIKETGGGQHLLNVTSPNPRTSRRWLISPLKLLVSLMFSTITLPSS